VNSRRRIWRSAVFVALLAGAAGCYQAPAGLHYEDTRRFQQRPEGNYRVAPVARVDETLYGFNLFGISVKPLKPEKLQEKYLDDPTLYFTNWQVLTAVIDIPYVQFLFNMPYARVIFDVVRVEEQAP
jgi:hypothetical protein